MNDENNAAEAGEPGIAPERQLFAAILFEPAAQAGQRHFHRAPGLMLDGGRMGAVIVVDMAMG